MSSYPITELITLDVIAALKSIRVSNGYSFDAIVEREEPKRGNTIQPSSVIVREGEEDPLDSPGTGIHEWNKPLYIECYAVETDDSTTAAKQRANGMNADVIKALRANNGWTRNGLAVDTLVRSPRQILPENGGYYGVSVQIDVHYRTNENDPYTQG